jgi:hypothetical protein
MRRRTGAPSNYLETTGKNMARMHKTSDEHYAEHSAAGSSRIPMGMDSPDLSAYGQTDELNQSQMQGTLVPKKSVQAGDPTGGGSSPRRTPVLNAGGERLGASYVPKAMYGVIDPAAGLTMRNARLVPSVAGRQTPDFGMGMQASQY